MNNQNFNDTSGLLSESIVSKIDCLVGSISSIEDFYNEAGEIIACQKSIGEPVTYEDMENERVSKIREALMTLISEIESQYKTGVMQI